MNWHCPMAPAHDPTICEAGTSPLSMMVKALNNSPLKNAARRPSQAKVAKEAGIE